MTTKEWLNRARHIDKEINALMNARHSAYMSCVSTTPRLRVDIIKADKDPHAKLERLAELNQRIDDRIDNLLSVKAEMLDAIWMVEDSTYRVLLVERYVNLKTWEQIAAELSVPESTARGRLHSRSLGAIRNILCTDKKDLT